MESSFLPNFLWSYLECGLHLGRELHRDRQRMLEPNEVRSLVQFSIFIHVLKNYLLKVYCVRHCSKFWGYSNGEVKVPSSWQ